MKFKSLVAALALASGTAFASEYNTQLDVDYFDADGADAYTIQGTYYFENVNTANTAWAEAAFMGHNNNVGVAYADFDGDVNALALFGEYFGDNNFYGRLSYTDVDYGVADDSVIGAEVGYMFEKNWLVALGTTSSDGEDPIYVRTKYVADLGNGNFFNFEAQIDDEDFWSLGGDYYFQPETSFGVVIDEADDTDGTLRFQHFFNNSVALKVSHTLGDVDVTSIGITARF